MASLIKWVHPKSSKKNDLKSSKKRHYYPANIGEILRSKYQIVGKLGFGVTSTVWLARDLDVDMSHPGYVHVGTALDRFTIPHLGNHHHCLVQKPIWESFTHLLYRNPTHRFTEDLLRAGLKQVFLALDYLHRECKLVHANIKSDNILQEIEDTSILNSFSIAEKEHPSSRKYVITIPIYASRWFDLPRAFGMAVLSDFGSAVQGDETRNHNPQPNGYRAPEVMLKAEWSYPIDIWNVGVMDLFEGKHLFDGDDSDGKGYSTRAHLAEVNGILGPLPLTLVRRGTRSPEFFTEDGYWKSDIEISKGVSLHNSEEFLSGRNKEMFLEFLKGMLQWKPEDRKTAKELLQDPWLNGHSI
ncbi:CMGC protein kinase [Penicillium concentricum]|uniref:CMGC protein kinase n=1 Tax=Penicillium concentricum TaxID=293559 RepID=A0A9W9R9V5_9EURO|nr:CMGC protein kinase [Penicillium concentricum]KAJ5356372.1 CMGC protein kinase [Penicillium concentricum]